MKELISEIGYAAAMTLGMGGILTAIIKHLIEKDKAAREDTNKIIENMRIDAKEDRDMYKETINKFDDKLDKFSIALETNNIELREIKQDVEKIKDKVGV